MIILNNNETQLKVDADINQTVFYLSTDSKEVFKKNKAIMGPDWKYYNNPIEYKFNSAGYRTKEINDLETDFVLTFGCSYTEGVGLHTEDIWTHHVSEYLGYDLYNHAKGGTGMDMQYYNGTLWNMANRPLPKLVIAQWPYKTRKHFAHKEQNRIFICDHSYVNTVDGKWWKKRYIQDQGELEINILHWFENFNNTWKLAGVPVLNFTWDDNLRENLTRSRYQLYQIRTKTFDRARDLSHDGAISQKETADRIKKLLKLPNFTDKI